VETSRLVGGMLNMTMESRNRAVADSDRLRILREGFPLTVRELADISEVSLATISSIENKHRSPNPSTIRKLAQALGVEPAEIMKEVEENIEVEN
jgi:transcriptional regulator with XRE-family HTH domain